MLVLFPVVLAAQPSIGRKPLQFDDVWKIGLASNASTLIQKARTDAARVNAIASFFSGLSRPDVEVEFPSLLSGSTAIGSIEARQALSLSGLFGIDTLIAFDQLGVEEALVQMHRGRLYADIRRVYASIIITGKEIGVARENVELLRQLSVRMQINYQTGKATKSDFLQTAIELRRAEQDYTEVVNREKIARSELNLLIGLPIEQKLVLDDAVMELDVRLPELERITNNAVKHPAVRQQSMAHGAADKTFWKELLNIIPAPFAGIRQSGGDTAVIFGVTLPLWDFNARAVAQSAAERTAAEVSLAQTRREAAFTIHVAYINAARARQNLDTLKNGMEDAQELIKYASMRYNENGIDLYKYLAYIKTANEARIQFYQGILDYDVALAELERALHTTLRTKEYL